ncbi:MAG: hypothetical protein QM680_12065 [Luteolibacter sp.]
MKSYLLVICTCLLMIACRDTSVTGYQTRQEAEADRLFERGWLPAIIPESSYGIVVKNDLDLNVSEGEFRFKTEDREAFLTRLKRESSADEVGFFAYRYEAWSFLISAEEGTVFCKYRMSDRE